MKAIKENLLRDSRYPVHRIADKLLPFIKILVERFEPEQVILFGSYAYGNPSADSDVDLLVVKKNFQKLERGGYSYPEGFSSVAPYSCQLTIRYHGARPTRSANATCQWGIFSFADHTERDSFGMKTDENNPEDWYRSGRIRLVSAVSLTSNL